jgi:hypothetical protein
MVYGKDQIDRIIGTDKFNSIVFNALKESSVYVVGGYIRDVLVGKNPMDRDYVTKGGFIGLLGRVAAEARGKLVRIGKGELHRIVLRNGMTLDFSPLRENIAADLSDRDFTINSMAWSPQTGLIDLYQGFQDISGKFIRIVHGGSIEQDPVRILRAYRFASELNFEISHETRLAIMRFRRMLGEAKNERITLEFIKILNAEDTIKPLSMMLEDGVLSELISRDQEDLAMKVDVIYQVRQKIDKLPLRYRFKASNIVSQGLSLRGLYLMEILLSGLPDNLLSLSTKIRKRISLVDKARSIMREVDDVKADNLFEVLDIVGDPSLDYLITGNLTEFIEYLERYQEILKNPLLNAEDVHDITGVDEGILMGRVIKAARKANFLGQIRTRKDAEIFIRKIVRDSNLT